VVPEEPPCIVRNTAVQPTQAQGHRSAQVVTRTRSGDVQETSVRQRQCHSLPTAQRAPQSPRCNLATAASPPRAGFYPGNTVGKRPLHPATAAKRVLLRYQEGTRGHPAVQLTKTNTPRGTRRHESPHFATILGPKGNKLHACALTLIH